MKNIDEVEKNFLDIYHKMRLLFYHNISQSNATYKVNSLIKKGYLEKQNSTIDRREYHLILSQKYYNYRALMGAYIDKMINRMGESYSEQELKQFNGFLETISTKMMPEYDEIVSKQE